MDLLLELNEGIKRLEAEKEIFESQLPKFQTVDEIVTFDPSEEEKRLLVSVRAENSHANPAYRFMF